jgi:hypothetical protein
MTKELTKVTRGSRPKRAPIGTKNRLSVSNKEEGREYRFVNDRDGRVEMFQQNGWIIEKAENHNIGDRRAESASVMGSAARVSVGQGDTSVLMSIDKEWYLEDQAEKHQRVDASEQSIKDTALKSHKGAFEISRG